MAKTRTEIQAKYDAAHRTTISMKLHNDNDADILEKLASVSSVQGYIKQLIRQDIARTRSVPDTASVPTSSVPKKESEEKHMKTYHIKPEYFDLWFGKESPDPDYIVTQDELENLSREWETPVPELLEQLDEIN